MPQKAEAVHDTSRQCSRHEFREVCGPEQQTPLGHVVEGFACKHEHKHEHKREHKQACMATSRTEEGQQARAACVRMCDVAMAYSQVRT